ncbi:hypothetical protein GTW43_22025 [Streptomyces sp. SID5785]|uniref:hypothetical protein n=1 Tax=Streptomyces sp. SID5785 TaxID=2690309 RepID=UPI0013612F6B|nr:hypothetical protein [Streptomyces sp. SID5785]MZD07737.1 hypothetical protein [Streptomyces sp. SID5785]
MDAEELPEHGAEEAMLVGGPADGVRVHVTDRPRVLQVSRPCALPAPADGFRIDAQYVYRRILNGRSQPLRYGYDSASP